MCIKENIIRVKTGICWYNESNTVCEILFRGGVQWHPDIFASKWDERFFSFRLWFTLIATGFYFLWDLGNRIPIMRSSSLHILSATFSQCRQISIYNKDFLHQIWLPCCQASYWSLGLRRSNESWVQHLFKYCFFFPPLVFMFSIDCISTCFSIINVSENSWMIMQSSKFFVLKLFWNNWFSFFIYFFL